MKVESKSNELPPLDNLAKDIIEQAAKDAAKGDPTAGAWLLSDTAEAYADLAGFKDGFLGKMASKALERFYHGS